MAQLDERISTHGSRLKTNLRWYIAGLLMLTTTLSYLDRQSFSIASVVIIKQFHFTASDYGKLGMIFSLAYGLAMPFTGRFIDWVGARRGLAISMFTWSIASVAHAVGNGILSFGICRGILGITESNNFPAAAKVVSEWFPPKERATGTGVYNCGAGFGALIAPPLIASFLIPRYGWRVAFLITGSLGFLLVMIWIRLYYSPAEHPKISPEELAYIRKGQEEGKDEDSIKESAGSWQDVLRQRNFWGMAIARILSDPVWGFYLIWLAPYLSQVRHLSLMQIGLLAWVPFLTADFGSVVGGAYSSWWIKRGITPTTARKIGMCTAAALMPLAILAARVNSPVVAIFLFSTVTFSHQAWSANTLTLPMDLFPKRMVARTFGLAAGMSNIATALFAYYTGWMIDRHGFTPVFLIVAFMHPLAAMIAAVVIRNRDMTLS